MVMRELEKDIDRHSDQYVSYLKKANRLEEGSQRQYRFYKKAKMEQVRQEKKEELFDVVARIEQFVTNVQLEAMRRDMSSLPSELDFVEEIQGLNLEELTEDIDESDRDWSRLGEMMEEVEMVLEGSEPDIPEFNLESVKKDADCLRMTDPGAVPEQINEELSEVNQGDGFEAAERRVEDIEDKLSSGEGQA